MTRRSPRDIGTRGETAVVRAAHAHGFPWADRFPLRGINDTGDLALCPGIIVQVKAGDAARDASEELCSRWLDATANQRDRAGAEHAFLVVQRRGVGVNHAERWHAYWRWSWLMRLQSERVAAHNGTPHAADLSTVRMPLHITFGLLRASGWGEPL